MGNFPHRQMLKSLIHNGLFPTVSALSALPHSHLPLRLDHQQQKSPVLRLSFSVWNPVWFLAWFLAWFSARHSARLPAWFPAWFPARHSAWHSAWLPVWFLARHSAWFPARDPGPFVGDNVLVLSNLSIYLWEIFPIDKCLSH